MYLSTAEEDTVEGLVNAHPLFCNLSCLGIAEVEVDPLEEERDILGLGPEKESDVAEADHHIEGKVTLGLVPGRESLDAQFPTLEVVPIQNHLGQVLIHLHQNIDQRKEAHRVSRPKNHDHLLENVLNHLKPKTIKFPHVKNHLDDPGPGPENLKILR